jgi:MFS family permease
MTIQVIPTYARERIGADAVAAGLAVTIGSLATMVARPIAGRIADRKGGRPVVMVGSILGCVGGLAHLIATNIPMLIVARLILGAGEGALFTAAIGWVLSDADPARRGKIAGHFGLSMWTGLAGGPVLGAALLALSGYRAVWLAACFLPAVAWLILLRSPRATLTSADQDVDRALLPSAAWVPGISMAFSSIGYGVIAAFLVPRFVSLDLPGHEFALAVFGAAFLLMRFVGSPMVDLWGAPFVLALALTVEAIGLLGLFATINTCLVFICTALSGVGISMLYPCLASLVTDSAPAHERSAAIGAMTSAWDLGLAVGGPLGGLVAGSMNAGPFALGAAGAIIAMLPVAARARRSVALSRRS